MNPLRHSSSFVPSPDQSFETLVMQAAQVESVSPVSSAPQPVKYAGFWVRYVASMIDGFVLIIPSAAVLAGATFLIPTGSDGIGNVVRMGVMNSILSVLPAWMYSIAMLSKYQATLGKRAMGLIVVSDKTDHLTIGQIILRETVGKILSSITLGIGYIMAGFTARKQSLHDKVAGTLVIYKDPNVKTSTGLIVGIVVIAVIAVPLVIMGILSAITAVSLGSAKEKAQDAMIKSKLSAVVPEMLIYQDGHETFKGFASTNLVGFPACAGQPIVNIATDGSSMAVFSKLCTDTSYFCADMSGTSMVEVGYATGGATSCALVSNKNNVTNVQKSDAEITTNVREAARVINDYGRTTGSYAGYWLSTSPNNTKFKVTVDDSQCASQMKLDVSPDGENYVVHQPLCSNAQKSVCSENGMNADTNIISTNFVNKAYTCEEPPVQSGDASSSVSAGEENQMHVAITSDLNFTDEQLSKFKADATIFYAKYKGRDPNQPPLKEKYTKELDDIFFNDLGIVNMTSENYGTLLDPKIAAIVSEVKDGNEAFAKEVTIANLNYSTVSMQDFIRISDDTKTMISFDVTGLDQFSYSVCTKYIFRDSSNNSIFPDALTETCSQQSGSYAIYGSHPQHALS